MDKIRRKLLAVLLCVCMILSLAGCSKTSGDESEGKQVAGSDGSVSQTILAMDTTMTVTCYGENAQAGVDACVEEIQRLDDMLSVGNEDSEISQVNAKGEGSVSEDTGAMISEALELYESTGGAFDITIYPLMELWGFTNKDLTSEDFVLPENKDIQNILQYTGSDKLNWDDKNLSIKLGENQGIDLGGIAKGYTSNKLMQIMKEAGVDCGLVSLGGNIQCLGCKEDGSKWNCAITNPEDPDSANYMGALKVEGKAIITSGGYERYFEDQKTGKIYQHILDPKTGYPADTDLISATIVCDDGMLADGLSTSTYVMGLDKSLEYWKNSQDDFDMILMTADEEVYVTEGIAEEFTSDFEVNVVNR